jgi:hypothetical protein
MPLPILIGNLQEESNNAKVSSRLRRKLSFISMSQFLEKDITMSISTPMNDLMMLRKRKMI